MQYGGMVELEVKRAKSSPGWIRTSVLASRGQEDWPLPYGTVREKMAVDH